jgi:hypothetical protein
MGIRELSGGLSYPSNKGATGAFAPNPFGRIALFGENLDARAFRSPSRSFGFGLK